MINLFFVTHDYLGVGTYCKELLEFLKGQTYLTIYQLFLESEQYSEYTEIIQENILNIYIPAVQNTRRINLEKYSARCLDLLDKNVNNKQNVIFHLNHSVHAQFGMKAKSRFGARIVYTLHFLPKYYSELNIDVSFKDDLVAPRSASERRMIHEADRIICVTHFAKKILIDHFNTPKQKVTAIHNGIGTISNKHILSTTQKDLIRCELGFGLTEKIILFVGQLEQRKGISFLLKAFNDLSLRHPDTRLVVVGDGDFKETLRLMKGNWGKITITGNISSNEVIKFYQIACIGVIPSIYEQCSYVALEMMKYGLPIIVSKVPGLQELFIENKNALFISSYKLKTNDKIDVELLNEELTKKLIILLNDSGLRYQLGLNAKKHWEYNFLREYMGKITLNQYCKLTEETYDLIKKQESGKLKNIQIE